MPRPTLTALAVTLALSTPAFALPTLEKATAGGVSFLKPAGWSVRVEQGPATAIHIEERAGAADSPSVMLMSMPLQQGPQTPALFAAQMVQTVMATPKQEAQQAAPGGGLQVWSGTIGGIPAKLAIVHQALPAQGVGLLGAFAAPTARFDQLGGVELLTRITGSLGAAAVAQPSPAQPAAVAGALTVPPPYAGTSMPVVHYLTEKLESLTPAQIAAGLRQLNDTERLTLGIYGAYANLLHAMGCQADPTLLLVTQSARQTCAQTLQQWAQTIQFVGQAEAPRQAATERGQLRVAARCTSGQLDPASCGTYQRTLSDLNAQSHDTMIRMIRNLGGNTCTVGEAGCVPY